MRNLTNNDGTGTAALERYSFITQKPRSLPEEMTMILAKGGYRRLSKVTVFTRIKAPVEVCFDLVTKQLEETPEWDPTIRWVVPISSSYIRVGNESRVTFDLAGSTEEAIVVLRSFVQNKAIVWTSNHSNRLREQWQFKTEPDNSTLVILTLSYNPNRKWFKYFSRPARIDGQIEKAVSVMLGRLKTISERPVNNIPEPIYI